MTSNKVLQFGIRNAAAGGATATVRARLLRIDEQGAMWVRDARGTEFACDLLEHGVNIALAPDDVVLAMPPDETGRGVVLGRVGRLGSRPQAKQLSLEATESLSLKCGDASIELRADGKLMVKGEDVLVKARGTQRIKAGSVNIN